MAKSLGAAASTELANPAEAAYEVVSKGGSGQKPGAASPAQFFEAEAKNISQLYVRNDTPAYQKLFTGLGDEKTSPWLADRRVGVRTHIEEFRNGGSFVLPKNTVESVLKKYGQLGRNDGLFITTKAKMDQLISTCGQNPELIKQKLGIPSGQWSGDLVRIDVFNPLLHNARMPSGLEKGANEYFLWGGYTKGGMPEVIIAPLKAGHSSYSISLIKAKK